MAMQINAFLGLTKVQGTGQLHGTKPAETDLHSAFDQIEGHKSRVCGATAQNSAKATQEEILLGSKLTTVSLYRKKVNS